MPRLSLSLLGPKQILLDGKPLRPFTYQKAFALLAYLALEANVPHSRQALVGLLWPDLPNAAALTNLRQVLADLRQVLGDDATVPSFLLITRENIQFNVESDFQLDITTFLQLLSTCESHAHRHPDRCRICQARLEAALELYRGDFLSGFSVEGAAPFEDWVGVRREQLHQQAQRALVCLVNYQLRCRNDEKARRYLHRQVELEPWHEEAHQQLMRLYARNGQRSSALIQYESCHRILRTELGVAPARLTQLLRDQIRDGLPLVEDSSTLQPRYWHNLPLATTSLVGRSEELAQLGELLALPAHRLITILGPGGIGKTRLALAAAAENAVGFRNGVLFVSLAGVSDVHFLPNAIIAALDTPLPARSTPQEQLLTLLREQELLLLLDNYEQLLPDVSFLTQLLRSAPGVTVLVTSRERLAMQAEHHFEIDGLAYPRSGTPADVDTLGNYSALHLFVQRVRQTQRNFALTQADAKAILRIGRITEGMPLALELAAAVVRVHSCTAIADALENGQQLLSTQLRDLPERQRSMQNVFAHSIRLLSAGELQALCALAFFRGGFTAEAAEEVAGAPRHLLATLVDKSLLRMSHAYRYDMHELMRQYIEKELVATGASAQVRERYNAYFMGLAKAAGKGLTGPQPGEWIARLEPEIDNLRTVLHWLSREVPEDALQMAMDLFWLWQSRSYLQEGLDWLVNLSVPEKKIPSLLLASAYRAAGFFAICLNQEEVSFQLISKSLAIIQSLDMTERSVAETFVHTRATLMYVFLFQGDYEQVIAIGQEVIALAETWDFKAHVVGGWYNLGEAYMMQEKYDAAKVAYEKSLAVCREIGDLRRSVRRVVRLAKIAVSQGDYEQAKALCEYTIRIYESSQDQVSLSMALLVKVWLATMQGHFERAALLLGATNTIMDSNPVIRTWPQDRRSYEASVTFLRQHLEAGIFEQQLTTGRALSIEQTIALALAQQNQVI